MSDRCQFAAGNGLSQQQIGVLESSIDAISLGLDPVDSLQASEPLLARLQQLQLGQPSLRPKNESRYEALAKLQSWMAENAPESHAGILWEFSKNGNSVCAKQHLDAGSVFISIPKIMMLEATPGILQSNSIFAQIPSVALTLQLLIETRRSSSVSHALYIASLPHVGIGDLNCAWLWNFEEIRALLEGSSAFNKAIRTRLSTIQHYVYIIGRVKLPKVLSGLSWMEWMWASAIVLSRQNELPDGTPVLIPCWDMCNDKHSGAESYFIPDEDRIVAECKGPIESGDEIFINYGQRSCAQLLVLQGYLDREHITAVNVQTSLKDLGALPDDIEKLRAMLFEKLPFSPSAMTISPDGTISSALKWAARIACLNRDDAAFLLRNPSVETINNTNEERSRLSLQAFVSRLLQDALTAQQRLDSLKSSQYSTRLVLAKLLINIEIDIFKAALKKLVMAD